MQEKNTSAGRGPVFFRKRDLLIVVVLVLVAGIGLAVALLARPGGTARVTFVRQDTRAPVEISLGRDGRHTIEGDLPVTLEVQDGTIRFVDSVCPDHLCEGMGWLRRQDEWAACLPAGVMVTVVEESAAE